LEHSPQLRTILWISGEAFLIALVLTPILRDIFRAYNVVDRPGFRKIHAYPIPRLGGISLAMAYSIGLAALGLNHLIWQLLPGTAVIFLIGILDDFFNLPAGYKFLGQIAAGCLAFWSGLRIPSPGIMSFPLTVFWLVLCANAFNLIDGLDGLCAGLGCTGALALFAMAWIRQDAGLEGATLPLAGALLGFLCYNLRRATMFLGDSGALLIGFILGGCGVMWTGQTGMQVVMVAPLLALSVPLADVFLSVLRRLASHRPIFSADRAHIHHRLLDRGLYPTRVVFVLYAWGMCGGVFAWLLGYPPMHGWRWPLMAGFVAMLLAAVHQLRYPELKWRHMG